MAGAGALCAPHCLLAQAQSPFKLGVISDEISNDFNHACAVASKEFGLQWISLRTLWNRSVVDLDPGDVSRAKTILKKYNLQVRQIAGPLFKSDWPEAPRSKFSAKQYFANADFFHQHNVLARCFALAEEFKTDMIRCFDFWRLDDVAPHREAMDALLRTASEAAARQGFLLVLESDFECNTATSAEAERLLRAVPKLMLNWDPANAVQAGELDAFPNGWNLLPKERIRHCHCKNVVRKADGTFEWSPPDIGLVDWAAQFRALKDAGYHDGISLETHWRGDGTPEASSRASWAAMKRLLEASGTL